MGFQAMVQAWDFRPGTNWVQKMNDGLQSCARMIAVLSPDYLNSVYGAAEWQAMWAQDAQGTDRRLLPVRVRDFKVSGLLSTVVYIDLFGTDETAARSLLVGMLDDASTGRAKPDAPPPFPGGRPPRQRPRFPATPPAERNAVVDGAVLAAMFSDPGNGDDHWLSELIATIKEITEKLQGPISRIGSLAYPEEADVKEADDLVTQLLGLISDQIIPRRLQLSQTTSAPGSASSLNEALNEALNEPFSSWSWRVGHGLIA